jgi:hypothetical protein
MATLALNVEILGEFQKLTKATQGAEGSLGKLNDRVSSISSGMAKAIGGIAIALGFTGIVSGLRDAVAAAEEAEVANQRIDAIAKSMDLFGNQTKRTTDRIKAFAEEQELLIGVEAEVLKATQAKLLTFKQVALSADVMGGAFDRATVLAADLAAAGFGEATANATQLGKALNDPIAGISALTRVGLTFTAAQKDLIASLMQTGDVAGAQEVILAELERQVGGTAEATVTDSEKMRLALDRVGDEIGASLLPLLNEFTTWLTSPEGQETLDLVIEGVTEILTELVNLTKFVIENKDWLLPMVAAIGGVTAAWNLATVAVNGFKTAAGIAAFVSGSAVATAGAVAAGAATGGFMQGQALGQQSQIYAGSGFQQGGGLFGDAFQQPAASFPSSSTPAQYTVNNYVTARTDATPREIADAINRANKATGTNIIRGINSPR